MWTSRRAAFLLVFVCSSSFFFNDTATTEIYTLSLHDALPISVLRTAAPVYSSPPARMPTTPRRYLSDSGRGSGGRTSAGREIGRARLNSSHLVISYAVFCLKKKTSIKPTVVLRLGLSFLMCYY